MEKNLNESQCDLENKSTEKIDEKKKWVKETIKKERKKKIVSITSAALFVVLLAVLIGVCVFYFHRHDFEYVSVLEATCQEKGITKMVCWCGAVGGQQEFLADHIADKETGSHLCKVCGESFHTPSTGLDFFEDDAGACYVSGMGTCTDTEIVIPRVYNGKPVIGIGHSAFNLEVSLTSIVISDSVTSIGDFAFYLCNSLKSVVIPDSVKSMGVCVFEHCSSLTSITIPDSVTKMGYGTFEGCTSLTNVVLSDSLTYISYSAFRGCTSLESIIISDSVTRIIDEAFADCSSLTSVTFENPSGWWYALGSSDTSGTSISPTDLADPTIAATYLRTIYYNCYWNRSE